MKVTKQDGTMLEVTGAPVTREGEQLLLDGELVTVIDEHPVSHADLENDVVHVNESKFIDSLSVDFWLQFPIEVRPLKFVPGRNRKEKRTFRALASKQERGTITTGRAKFGGGREGGQLGKLHALYMKLAAAGVLKQTGGEKK